MVAFPDLTDNIFLHKLNIFTAFSYQTETVYTFSHSLLKFRTFIHIGTVGFYLHYTAQHGLSIIFIIAHLWWRGALLNCEGSKLLSAVLMYVKE